jgi:hypothetical protein
MYLFTRSRRIDPGKFTGALEATTKMTETARQITGHQIEAWNAVMSPEFGTVVWTMWAEHLADVESAGDKLAADSSFMKMVEKSDDVFDGPMVDTLAMLVHGTPDLEGAPPNYVAVVTATAANGRLNDAITSGVEIAEASTRLGGQQTLFVVGATGVYGGVAWLTACPDIDTLEASEVAVSGSPDFLSLVDRVGTAYLPNATQTLYRRIM